MWLFAHVSQLRADDRPAQPAPGVTPQISTTVVYGGAGVELTISYNTGSDVTLEFASYEVVGYEVVASSGIVAFKFPDPVTPHDETMTLEAGKEPFLEDATAAGVVGPGTIPVEGRNALPQSRLPLGESANTITVVRSV